MSPGQPLVRARATSVTASGFVAPVATKTRPAGAGVVDLSSTPPGWLRVVPFGTGSATQTFDVRVIGWTLVSSLWVPVILCQFTATLSTFVGVSGSDVTAGENFCDTVSAPAANLGSSGVDCQPKSPQNNTPAHYLIDAIGCSVFEVDISNTSATAGNALLGTA